MKKREEQEAIGENEEEFLPLSTIDKVIQYMKETPLSDINFKEAAKGLLVTTSLRVSEIADRLGYSDLAYFSNNFKRITGHSPSEYRKAGGTVGIE